MGVGANGSRAASLMIVAAAVVAAGVVALQRQPQVDTIVPAETRVSTPTLAADAPPTTAAATTTTTQPFVARTDVLVDPASFGRPWGTTVNGVLTLRGNPTRSFQGTGPLPTTTPQILWKYPKQGMCGLSSEYGEQRTWCGTGWTGQPAVFERDGRTWVVFGAYDYKIHFVDAATGTDIIPPFATKDLAKGNVTIDPDGYPLVYAGSRDNYLRVIAFDGAKPRELWRLDGHTADRMWNDDWDGAPMILGDHLVTGGENSWFIGYKLNRGYAADGSVTVAPSNVFRVPGWDQQLVDDLGNADPKRVSLEASVAVSGDTAYLNSSGGLVQGWDLSPLRTGRGEISRTFRFWTGDDSDATVVPDADGYLYVGTEVDRGTKRGREVGQLLKLDPRRADNPVVWSVDLVARGEDGTWTTPIVTDSVVIWTSKAGTVYGIDRRSGEIVWETAVNPPVLSSPVLVDGVLIQADGRGTIHAYDLGDAGKAPRELWAVLLGTNVESTPTVWKGRIYVGSRDGFVYAIG